MKHIDKKFITILKSNHCQSFYHLKKIINSSLIEKFIFNGENVKYNTNFLSVKNILHITKNHLTS